MRANLIHCSYHKCLTVYFGRIMDAVFNRCLPWSHGYPPLQQPPRGVLRRFRSYRIASVNNRALDLERLGRFQDLALHSRSARSRRLRLLLPQARCRGLGHDRVTHRRRLVLCQRLRARGPSRYRVVVCARTCSRYRKRRACWRSWSSARSTSSRWRSGRPDTPTSSPTATKTSSATRWRCFASCSTSTELSALERRLGHVVREPLLDSRDGGGSPRSQPGFRAMEAALHAPGETGIRRRVRRAGPAARVPGRLRARAVAATLAPAVWTR